MTLGGKHLFGSIGETRVSFIEKKIEAKRKDFLKKLLELNGLEVIVEELAVKNPEEDPQLYNIGVTDMTFNPTIAVFERKLKTFNNKKVTQDYWLQRSENVSPQYWKND